MAAIDKTQTRIFPFNNGIELEFTMEEIELYANNQNKPLAKEITLRNIKQFDNIKVREITEAFEQVIEMCDFYGYVIKFKHDIHKQIVHLVEFALMELYHD